MKQQLTRDLAIFGIQGSGKTTQAGLLLDYLEAEFFYFGGELRKRVEQGGPFGEEVAHLINQGNQVEGRHIQVIIEDFFAEHTDSRILFDTPVRNFDQKPVFDRALAAANRQVVFIYLELDEATARARLAGQTARADTSPEAIDRRLSLFYSETVPVLQAYEQEGLPFLKIDASAKIEDIQAQIRAQLAPFLKK